MEDYCRDLTEGEVAYWERKGVIPDCIRVYKTRTTQVEFFGIYPERIAISFVGDDLDIDKTWFPSRLQNVNYSFKK